MMRPLGFGGFYISPLPPADTPEQGLDEFAEVMGCYICDRHALADRTPARRDFRQEDVAAIELRWPGHAETRVTITILLDGYMEVPSTADSPVTLRLRDRTEADWFINRLMENLGGLGKV